MSTRTLTFPELAAPASADASQIRTPQAAAFFGICFYVLSQVYMVPLAAIGPSWAVWPSLTDFSVLFLAACIPFLPRHTDESPQPLRELRRNFTIVFLLALASYVVVTCNLVELRSTTLFNDKGVFVGAYQLYRLIQFGIVLYVQSRLYLTQERRRVLCRITQVTLALSCAGIIANYFDLISTAELAPHLSHDLSVAGPWAFYSRGIVGRAVGTLSFHHAYPPVQVMLLAALYLHLAGDVRICEELLVLGSTLLATFLSGSRTGWVVALLFVILIFLNRPKWFAIALASTAVAIGLCFAFEVDFSRLEPAIHRQATIASSYEVDGLAGRVDIWDERIQMLDQSPVAWLIGTGFGAAIETGANGHLLFLHIVVECGLVGLLLFSLFQAQTLRSLWRSESGTKPVFCVTIALVISGITQETFYPVTALGHFLGFYVFVVSIALQAKRSAE